MPLGLKTAFNVLTSPLKLAGKAVGAINPFKGNKEKQETGRTGAAAIAQEESKKLVDVQLKVYAPGEFMEDPRVLSSFPNFPIFKRNVLDELPINYVLTKEGDKFQLVQSSSNKFELEINGKKIDIDKVLELYDKLDNQEQANLFFEGFTKVLGGGKSFASFITDVENYKPSQASQQQQVPKPKSNSTGARNSIVATNRYDDLDDYTYEPRLLSLKQMSSEQPVKQAQKNQDETPLPQSETSPPDNNDRKRHKQNNGQASWRNFLLGKYVDSIKEGIKNSALARFLGNGNNLFDLGSSDSVSTETIQKDIGSLFDQINSGQAYYDDKTSSIKTMQANPQTIAQFEEHSLFDSTKIKQLAIKGKEDRAADITYTGYSDLPTVCRDSDEKSYVPNFTSRRAFQIAETIKNLTNSINTRTKDVLDNVTRVIPFIGSGTEENDSQPKAKAALPQAQAKLSEEVQDSQFSGGSNILSPQTLLPQGLANLVTYAQNTILEPITKTPQQISEGVNKVRALLPPRLGGTKEINNDEIEGTEPPANNSNEGNSGSKIEKQSEVEVQEATSKRGLFSKAAGFLKDIRTPDGEERSPLKQNPFTTARKDVRKTTEAFKNNFLDNNSENTTVTSEDTSKTSSDRENQAKELAKELGLTPDEKLNAKTLIADPGGSGKGYLFPEDKERTQGGGLQKLERIDEINLVATAGGEESLPVETPIEESQILNESSSEDTNNNVSSNGNEEPTIEERNNEPDIPETTTESSSEETSET